jgi:hypothetical protein
MTRQPLTCPTFAEIQVVTCEDGVSKAAYCYPRDDTEDGLIVVSLDDLPPEAFPTAGHLEADDPDDDDWWSR